MTAVLVGRLLRKLVKFFLDFVVLLVLLSHVWEVALAEFDAVSVTSEAISILTDVVLRLTFLVYHILFLLKNYFY